VNYRLTCNLLQYKFYSEQSLICPFGATVSIVQDIGFLQQWQSYKTSEAMMPLLLVNSNGYIY